MGGYRRYRLHMMEERLRAAMPHGLRKPLFGTLGNLYPKMDWAPRFVRAKTTFEGLARTSTQAYFHSMSIMRGPDPRLPDEDVIGPLSPLCQLRDPGPPSPRRDPSRAGRCGGSGIGSARIEPAWLRRYRHGCPRDTPSDGPQGRPSS